MKVYEAPTLLDTMSSRKKDYETLREQLHTLKKSFQSIVELDDEFQGKGADAIKGFYRAQTDVAESWLRLVDQQIAFFNGMEGDAGDKELSGDTTVEVPFLESDLSQSAMRADEMVTDQQSELRTIFGRINDIVSLDVFPRDHFDEQMAKAEKKRRNTIDAVEQLDTHWKSEYETTVDDQQLVFGLFQEMMNATRQGNQISPIHFNATAYHTSEIYQLKRQAEQQSKDYLKFKEEQAIARERIKELEELENRPWYEKLWDGTKTFVGEFSGYYDYLRATEGVDPITGEKLTTAQRTAAGAMAAAGFIPVVGWAGRAFKGGNAIYKTTKGINAADNALDAYQNAKAFKNLEKAEFGIYGLVSANGFGEYFTGKDMFGNELTDEQRQASLFQSLGIVGVAGAARCVDHLQAKTPKFKAPKSTVKSFDGQLDGVLKNHGLSRAEFNNLKLKPMNSLTDTELEKLKAIRGAVPPITKDTLIQKTIPVSDISKYLDGSYTKLGGYVAKAVDVEEIKSYDDFIESLRLDYVDKNGNRPYPEGGGPYGVVKFKTEFTDNVEIPYGGRFGGSNTDDPPCTLNGFTGSRNGKTIPEFRFDRYYAPTHGSELYKVVDGEEFLEGIYNEDLGKFVNARTK
ncbi:ribonuclease YeeF family protein [Pseudalkalibacillus decolorationis]|uniref:ribonuclease YeeF family protein n=1 Tax=Pseudalkalibacillus decolorationis TaxID=163879 RepID=UPI002149297E|nr:T7SS effector LXG polymorphic toxin [Pseudalkalibacillus decolorationis]